MLDFLAHLFDKGLSYSAINTARSAISQVSITSGTGTIGCDPLVVKFMKGVYNLRPPAPRYQDTWDVGVVLEELKRLSPTEQLTLKDLTLKLVMLLALVLAARVQTLHILDLDNMETGTSSYSFTLGRADLKQSRPGYSPEPCRLSAYTTDNRLCVCTVLKEYIARTMELRKSETKLLISYVKPHSRITKNTISRWIRTFMCKSGLNVAKYKPHSVRAATTSKAKYKQVPIEEIMKTAGWSNAATFARFYNKQIMNHAEFANKVLE